MDNSKHLDYFNTVCSPHSIISDSKLKKSWGDDWTKERKSGPNFVLLPQSTEEVSKILKYCYENNLKVVPNGGRTGMAGGAVACDDEIVISLDKMNKIIEIDTVSLSVCVEAGVITQNVQEQAKKNNLFFPIDLAAKGSCQIGGNIATNAGGLKFVAYGGMREQVIGLEVVLSDGTILDMNSNLRKNNTGYDLKHLFIGSEGTLGIITKARLKLVPKPRHLNVSCVAFEKFDDILSTLQQLHQKNFSLTAFEFFSAKAHKITKAYNQDSIEPFEKSYPFYGIIECDGDTNDSQLEEFLAESFENSHVSDATIASNSQEFANLWALRENISESLSNHGWVHKNDITVSIDKLSLFYQELEEFLTKKNHDFIDVILFGHVADGNIHINYTAKKTVTKEIFLEEVKKIEQETLHLVKKFKGSVSAEHGIGLIKKDILALSRSADEIRLMSEIKKSFDPKGILNPGKIL